MDPQVIGWIASGIALALAAVLFVLSRRRKSPETIQALEWEPSPELVDGHRPPDGEALSSQLLALVRQMLDAKGVAVLMPSREGWRVTLTNPGLTVQRSAAMPLKEGLLGLAFDGEREVTADPVHPQSIGYLAETPGPLSLALVPLSHRGKIRGLLACHRASGAPFAEPAMAVLRRCCTILDGWETFSAHYSDLARTHDQEDRLARGLERMLNEVDPRDIALLALDSLFDLLPAVFGFAVVESPSDRFACLVTKRFDPPESFQHMERGTWTYYVYSRSLEPLHLEGATSRDTAMPILYEGEPFATGAVSFLVPLRSSDQQFGVFGLVGKPEAVFPEEGRIAAERFIKQTAALMKLAQINFYNRENAIKDGLTDLHNRRHFEERIQEEFQRSQRTGAPLSLIMLDIDHFKRINDTYGHAVGDQTLRAVAQCARSALRSIDQIYRYGGEEFAVLLPGCPLAEAVVSVRWSSILTTVATRWSAKAPTATMWS